MTFLDELSTRTHDDRVRAMIELGRSGRDRDTIEALARGDVYERRLALSSCWGSRDGAHVLRALSDASRRVRGLALRLAAVVCDDAQALDALQLAFGMRSDRPLVRWLAERGRGAVIDRFLDWLRGRGARRELVDALAFGTEDAVRRHLAYALEQPSAAFYRKLARAHAGILGEVLIARWRAVPGEADPVTRQLTDAHHPRIAQRAPRVGLELARVLAERGIEPDPKVWPPLVTSDARACIALAGDTGVRLPHGSFRADRVDPAVLADVMDYDPLAIAARREDLEAWTPAQRELVGAAWARVSEHHPRMGALWLAHVPPDRREVAFERFRLAMQDANGIVAPMWLDGLPLDLRAREARRHMHEVVALEPYPVRRVTGYARHLPWEEAHRALTTLLGHPDGATRAAALSELLIGVGLQKSAHVDDALAMVLARKYEQDPVRGAMWSVLAGWPRALWRREHLDRVGQALRDGLDAADLSDATAMQGERLVIGLFGVDAPWGAKWLGTLLRERGRIYDLRLFAGLTDAELRTAAPAVLEVARTWATSERTGWLLLLVQALGARMALVDGLTELAAGARDTTPLEWFAVGYTTVLMQHAPAHAALAKTVRRFLDRAWFGGILQLASVRGGALDAELAYGVCEVARRSPRDYEVVNALHVLHRRDRSAFGRLVPELLAKDPSLVCIDVVWRFLHRRRSDLLTPFLDGRPIHGRFATGKTAWLFPATTGFFRWTPTQVELFSDRLHSILRDPGRDTPTLLWALAIWPNMEYARMDRLCALADDARPAVREKAIRVLARCDASQGIPTLLECLADARARFAIYGLRRAVLELPPRRALDVLSRAPLAKVTIAKEVVRLYGELRSDAGYLRLVELDRGSLHRDVRIALLRALWDHLERDETWEVFERAVDDPDWVLAAKVGDVPADRLTDAIDRKLSKLLARVLLRPEPEARLDLLQRAPRLAVRDPERTFLAACRMRLRSRYDDETSAAVHALMQRQDEHDVPAMAEALAALHEDPRSLTVAASTLTAYDPWARASWEQALAALEAVLDRPGWQPLRVRAARSRDIPRLVELAAELADRGTLDRDVVDELRAVLSRWSNSNALSALASRLIHHAHPEARRLALWAVVTDAGARGWSEERLAQLARVRADPDPGVAGAAARVFPPREKDV